MVFRARGFGADFFTGGAGGVADFPERIASTRSEIFLTFSETADATSGAFSLTNSVAAETCSWTLGSFQTLSAADFIWLYRARPARVPNT